MIFVFSASGNGTRIARRLAENEPIVDITQALRKGEFNYELKANEALGFVIPVYFFGLPECVKTFIEKLTVAHAEKAYIYLFLNAGSMTGCAGKEMKHLLSTRALTLQATFSCKMPDDYLPLFTVPGAAVVRDCLDKADAHVAVVREQIRAKTCGNFDTIRGFAPSLIRLIAKPMYHHTRKTKRFTVSDRCTLCGKCVANCPENAIQRVDHHVVWTKSTCTLCLGCLNNCPAAAIDCGRGTKGKQRYVCPLD